MNENKIGQIMIDVGNAISDYAVVALVPVLKQNGLKDQQIEKICNVLKKSIETKALDSVHFIYTSITSEKKDFKS